MYIVIFMLIACFVIGGNGDDSIATQTVRGKRSDGLMRELVDLLSEQKNERESLLKRCEAIEDVVKKLTLELGTTKLSVNNLKVTTARQHSNTLKRCKDVEKTVKTLTKSVKDLKKTTTGQYLNTQKQINGIVGTVKDLSIRTAQHSSRLTKIESDIKATNNTGGIRNRTAFSVRFKTANPTIAVSSDAIVKFNKIISNNGNGFSVATGKFTCKIPGLYFFTVTVISETNHGAACMTTNIKNNTKINIIEALTTYEVSRNQQGKRYESGTASTVLRLSVGDEVFVKSCSWSGTIAFEWNSSFSGMFVSE